mgnify:CR=1 FL=1
MEDVRKELNKNNAKMYNYQLKNGCRAVKPKPVRVYAELADIVIFSDACLMQRIYRVNFVPTDPGHYVR